MTTATQQETAGAAAHAAALGLADGLSLAAAPTFAIMALLAARGGGSAEMVCASHATSPLGGMAAMYVLMSAFHAAAWLRRVCHRRA